MTKNLRRGAAAIFLACMSGACAHFSPGANSEAANLTALSTSAASSRVGTIVSGAPSCPVADEEEALVETLIGFGAQFLVNFGSHAIENYQNGLNGQFAGGGVVTADHPENIHCLIIAHGLIGTGGANVAPGRSPLSGADLARLHLADVPGFYMEAHLTRQGDRIIIEPVFLSYAQTSALHRGSGRKHVSLVVAVDEHVATPAADSDDDDFDALFRFDFGQLEIGRHYPAATLSGLAASQQVPAASFGGANISALVTESEAPGPALQALSETYAARKDALQTAIEEAVTHALGRNSQH